MKKHPVIKYILILIISGSCGALASRIFMNFEDGVVGAIKNFSEWFGSMTPALHISICLFLSLMSVYSIHKLKKLLNSMTPENEDEIYDQIENQSNPGMMCSVLCTISNFFFLGASTAYLIPKNILISAVATLVFLSINTWVEVSQVNLIKKINPKFKNTDPMSMRFMKDWEKESDEAETFEMYRAGYQSYKSLRYAFLIAFALCCMIQIFYPIGLAPFILIAIFWGVHSLSYLSACGKYKKQ